MAEISIVPAKPADFERIAAFYKYVIENTETMPQFCRWIYGLHPTDDLIEGYIADGVMYMAEDDSKLVSVIAVTDFQGEDYHGFNWQMDLRDDEVAVAHLFCVDPMLSRRGTARAVMEKIMAAAKKRGKKAFRLDALNTNLPAQKMYESIGFIRCGTVSWYTRNVVQADFVLYEYIL